MGVFDILDTANKALNTADKAKQTGDRAKKYLPPPQPKKEEPAKEAKPVVPPPALDKDRQEAVVSLTKDFNLTSELRAQRKIHGDAPVEAAEKLIKLYHDRAGQKQFSPIKEEEVKKFLDTYETLKDGKRVLLDDKQKDAAREITWGAFSTMKGLIKDNSLDLKYNLVEQDGPVKDSKITILGTKK